jgi:hypothetical protein
MTQNWFKPMGWIYLPVSIPGAFLTLLCLAFCVHIFLFVDRNSHSNTDTLYGIFPFVMPALLALDWVARRTSGGSAPTGLQSADGALPRP